MMRIIAGTYRGIKLDEVFDLHTRPTTDKNKETLFNILGQFFEGGSALDLFAGTGALGIEAYSRGMEHITFVDKYPKAVETINHNLAKLKNADPSDFKIVSQDVFTFLENYPSEPFDLILIDPPYQGDFYEKVLLSIEKYNLLSNQGVIVFESEKTRMIDLRNSKLHRSREKVLGNTKFTFLSREE